MVDDKATNPDGQTDKKPDGKTSLATGVAWNLVSFGFMAIAGIVLNLIIGRVYGAGVLGTFNIAFAIFIFLSQIAVFGLHLSVLQAVSVEEDNADSKLRSIVMEGLLACVGIAAIVTLAGLALTPFLPLLFKSVEHIDKAWLIAAPGLLFFALNKYLLGALNGMQHMRAFALLQSMRFVFILALLCILMLVGAPGYWLTFALSGAECLLFPLLLLYIKRVLPAPPLDTVRTWDWARRHLSFGFRVFPAGMVAELNTRVDVLMLGVLMGDKAAGIYSVAGLIYEAALQLVIVLRSNINPQIARDIAAGRKDELKLFSRKLALFLTPVLAAGGVAAIALFPLFTSIVFPDKGFEEARDPLIWLMLALTFAGAPLCFSLILAQAGRPGWQSILMLMALVINGIGNAVLIPLFGIAGAGMAAGFTAFATGVMTVILCRHLLGIRLFL